MDGYDLMEHIRDFLHRYPADYARLAIVDHPDHPELKRFPGLEYTTVPRVDDEGNLFDTTLVTWPWLRLNDDSGHYEIDFTNACPTSIGDRNRLSRWFRRESVRNVTYELLYGYDVAKAMDQLVGAAARFNVSVWEMLEQFTKSAGHAVDLINDAASFMQMVEDMERKEREQAVHE